MNFRAGARFGSRFGPRIGFGSDGAASLAGVAQDATSFRYFPANATQWTSVMAVAGTGTAGPSSAYLFDGVAAGAIPDVIGSIDLTAAGTLSYQQSAAGYANRGVKTTAGAAGTMLSTSAALPDIGTTSCSLLAYVLLPTFAATLRTVVQLGAVFNTEMSAEINGTPKQMIFQLDPNTATGAVDNTSQVRPIWITINRTAGTAALDTDLEELTATLTATPTGKQFLLGGDNAMSNFPDNCIYLYAARFDGAAAELTKSQRRSVLQTLNWTIPW